MTVTATLIRQHVEQSAANDKTWSEYESIALDLTDAQIESALEKNVTVITKIADASAALDMPGLDYAIQALVLRAAEMHGVAYDVYALA